MNITMDPKPTINAAFNAGFRLSDPVPFDGRMMVRDLATLTSSSTWGINAPALGQPYAGMSVLVICADPDNLSSYTINPKRYICIDPNRVTELSNWYLEPGSVAGSQGVQGTTGTQGVQGATGSQGVQGSTGSQGVQGATGSQGVQGSTGSQGVQGATGSQGVQGSTGTQGSTGKDGTGVNIKNSLDSTSDLPATGVTSGDAYLINGHLWVYTGSTAPGAIRGFIDAGNIQGPQGRTGETGAQGTDGAQGVQGIVGPQGVQGTVGPQGVQGSTGSQGVQGTTGSQGVQGAVGPQGVQGSTGTQGVQGAVGTQGSTGKDGTGVNIKNSLDSTSDLPTTGVTSGDAYLINGHLWVYTGSTAPGAIRGFIDAGNIQGPQGRIGETGAQGADGSQGVQGVEGSQGVQGATGAQGVQGTTGSQGVQGVEGSQGVQGATGAQGVQGTTGPTGSSGNAGVAGVSGTYTYYVEQYDTDSNVNIDAHWLYDYLTSYGGAHDYNGTSYIMLGDRIFGIYGHIGSISFDQVSPILNIIHPVTELVENSRDYTGVIYLDDLGDLVDSTIDFIPIKVDFETQIVGAQGPAGGGGGGGAQGATGSQGRTGAQGGTGTQGTTGYILTPSNLQLAFYSFTGTNTETHTFLIND